MAAASTDAQQTGSFESGVRLQGSEFRVWGFRSDISGCEVCRITALRGTGFRVEGFEGPRFRVSSS